MPRQKKSQVSPGRSTSALLAHTNFFYGLHFLCSQKLYGQGLVYITFYLHNDEPHVNNSKSECIIYANLVLVYDVRLHHQVSIMTNDDESTYEEMTLDTAARVY